MGRYASESTEGSFFVDVLKIAIGVFIGALLSVLAYEQMLEQARQERIRQERKNAAWERFYQPPDACKADSSMMPCVNAYMAAKKRFELQYRD